MLVNIEIRNVRFGNTSLASGCIDHPSTGSSIDRVETDTLEAIRSRCYTLGDHLALPMIFLTHNESFKD
jgi:hypothetical protein